MCVCAGNKDQDAEGVIYQDGNQEDDQIDVLRLHYHDVVIGRDGLPKASEVLDRHARFYRRQRRRRPAHLIPVLFTTNPRFSVRRAINLTIASRLIQLTIIRSFPFDRVEPTVVPGAAFKDDEDYSSPFDVVSSQYVNEPSAFKTTGDYFQQPRIYFAELANFFANLFRTITLIEFATRTKTRTVTRTSTETTTNSFFLSGCTPSPFPFLICK